MWNLSPEKSARLKRLEETIRKKQTGIDALEERIGKYTRRVVLEARAIGELLNEVKKLLGRNYTAWVESGRFDGSVSTAYIYRRLAKPDVWEKVEERMRRPEGCTLREARAMAAGEPNKRRLASRRETLEQKLAEKFRKMITDWPEGALARLNGDLRFMTRIAAVANKRNELAKEAMRAQMIDV